MYGYATVSYNQIFDHLKFWLAFTAITTAVLKVKIVFDNQRWIWILSEAIMNYRCRQGLIVIRIRKLKSIHKLGQYSEVHKFVCVYLKLKPN